jgi:hypothetical protein
MLRACECGSAHGSDARCCSRSPAAVTAPCRHSRGLRHSTMPQFPTHRMPASTTTDPLPSNRSKARVQHATMDSTLHTGDQLTLASRKHARNRQPRDVAACANRDVCCPHGDCAAPSACSDEVECLFQALLPTRSSRNSPGYDHNAIQIVMKAYPRIGVTLRAHSAIFFSEGAGWK